jgi:photosystem II stability/assembly factor-like uncharacterized protein
LDNLPFTDISNTVKSFRVGDGSGLIIAQDTVGGIKEIKISTDASGNIVGWLVGGYDDHNNVQMQTNFNSPVGFVGGCDFSETTASFAGSWGRNFADPGKWTFASSITSSWSVIGPRGGNVISLAIDPTAPNTVYAGTDFILESTGGCGGVFKSTNGGASWGEIDSSLTESVCSVFDFAIDPKASATVYAATDNGVYKSGNGGASWKAVNSGLPCSDCYSGDYYGVFSLAIDPTTPTTLYAAMQYYGGNQNGGVYKSTNGGAGWKAVNTGLTNQGVYSLAMDPTTPTTLYAGSVGAGIYKSTNGGENWEAVNTGLPASTMVFSLAIDPETTTTIYAGTYTGVYKSTNGGENWEAINTGLPSSVYQNGIDSIAVNPKTPTILYAATWGGGVYKSTNGGMNWGTVNSGMPSSKAYVNRLAISAATPATIYAGTGCWQGSGNAYGIYKSSDGGAIWTAVNTGLPSWPYAVSSLASAATTPTALYAGTWGNLGGHGVFKTANRGANWRVVNTGLTAGDGSVPGIGSMAADPKTPTTLYAGTNSGVFRSTNGGVNWKAVNSGLPFPANDDNVSSLVIDPVTPAIIYALTHTDGVYKSTNGGAGWKAINSGLPSADGLCYLSSLTIDPKTPATLYAASFSDGVFKSINGGAGWKYSGLGSAQVNFLVCDPAKPNTLYAGSVAGFYKSTNGGANWIRVGSGPPAPSWDTPTALVIAPTTPATFYAGYSKSGVYESTNGGENWTAINTGLTDTNIASLAIDPESPTTIYAGTDEGVYMRTIAGSDAGHSHYDSQSDEAILR